MTARHADAPRPVAFLLGPFQWPTREEDVADELRKRGWEIAEHAGPGVDIIVLGTEADVATCDGMANGQWMEALDLARLTGSEVMAWSKLRLQLLCDDLVK